MFNKIRVIRYAYLGMPVDYPWQPLAKVLDLVEIQFSGTKPADFATGIEELGTPVAIEFVGAHKIKQYGLQPFKRYYLVADKLYERLTPSAIGVRNTYAGLATIRTVNRQPRLAYFLIDITNRSSDIDRIREAAIAKLTT